jgi:hypothetical protein
MVGSSRLPECIAFGDAATLSRWVAASFASTLIDLSFLAYELKEEVENRRSAAPVSNSYYGPKLRIVRVHAFQPQTRLDPRMRLK